MAGLLKPAAARVLVKTLKEETGLPIHLHTHDTAGIACATILAAAEAGVDAADVAMDAFSGNTSQAPLGTVVEALRHTERDTRIDIAKVRAISGYWEGVRDQYRAFESGMQAPTSEVYMHEMPGGQFTNLKAQARSLGLQDRWADVARMYADVNRVFGDIVKVTPSSKVVGDMALMMVSQGLTCADIEDPDTEVAFPDSVIDMLQGNLGQPEGGFPAAIVKKALKGGTALTDRPGACLPPADFTAVRDELEKAVPGTDFDTEDLMGYMMYPKVFTEYARRHDMYGPVRTLPTSVFFHGMEPGEEIEVEIDPGKTLVVQMQALGDTGEDGEVRVFFELNGQPRVIRVPDRKAKAGVVRQVKADADDPAHIGAPMPGVVSSIAVHAGQAVRAGDLLLTIEAMKMETGIHAERDAVVAAVHVGAGAQVDAKDLLIELAEA